MQEQQGAAAGRAEPRAFVGRRRELEELAAAVRAATAGSGGVVLLSGEPGVGKTRIADEASRLAREQGAAVAWGRTWEAGGAPPYWPWTRALRDVVGALAADVVGEAVTGLAPRVAAILPELSSQAPGPGVGLDAPADERFALFDAMSSFLRRLAASRPLVLVLDDLHAADEPTLLLLHFVARDARSAPLLLVGTYREAEAARNAQIGALLSDIGREGRHLQLSGLDRSELADLAAARFGNPVDEAMVASLVEATGGNPFFASELLQLSRLRSGMSLSRTDVPNTVRDTIRGRFDLLDGQTVETLRTAAVLGREFDATTLARATDQPIEQVLERLEPALDNGLLVESDSGFAFAHGLMRETLYDDTRTTTRAQLHAKVLESFERLGPADRERHLSELAHHALEAASAGADRAIDYARRAAAAAMTRLAFEEAVRHNQMALRAADLLGADATTRLQLQLNLSAAQGAAGDVAAGREAALAAAATARDLSSARGLADAALTYPSTTLLVFHPDAALRGLLREALEALEPQEHRLRSALLSKLAPEEYYGGGDARGIARRSLAEAEASGDPRTIATALTAQTFATGWDPVPPDAPWTDKGIRIAQRLEDADLEARFVMSKAYYALENGHIPELDRHIDRYTALAGAAHSPITLWWSKVMPAMRALWEGRYAEAESFINEAVGYGYRVAGPQALSAYGVQSLLMNLERRPISDILAGLRALPDQFKERVPARAGLAWAEALAGDRALARREFDALTAEDFAALPRDRSRLASMWSLTNLAIALGDRNVAERLVPMLTPHRGHIIAANVFGAFGTFDLCRGRLLALLGRYDEAEVALRDSHALAERSNGRPWVGHSLAELGQVLAAQGNTDGAAAALSQAAAIAADLDAVLLRSVVAEATEQLTQSTAHSARSSKAAATTPADPAVISLRQEGDFWSVSHPQGVIRLRDMKGLRYLAQLIANPGIAIHSMELVSEVGPSSSVVRPVGLDSDGFGSLGPALDPKAKAEYRRRVDELRQEIEEAEAFNDPERVARAKQEYDFLLAELSRAVGLGGRDRPVRSGGEQARINATKAIRTALRRIGEHDAALSEQLAVAVRTGTFCSYRPLAGSATWRFDSS